MLPQPVSPEVLEKLVWYMMKENQFYIVLTHFLQKHQWVKRKFVNCTLKGIQAKSYDNNMWQVDHKRKESRTRFHTQSALKTVITEIMMSRLFKREPLKEKKILEICEPLIGTGQLSPLSDFEKFLQLRNGVKHFSNTFFRCLSLCSVIFYWYLYSSFKVLYNILKTSGQQKMLQEASELRCFQTALLF